MMYKAQIALVTGASRGVGKGIAIALGAAGMTVYLSGRSATSSHSRLRGQILPGSLVETAEAVTRAGGQGIAVPCDHSDDEQVRALFARIEAEQAKKQAALESKDEIFRRREEFNQELEKSKNEIREQERRLRERMGYLNELHGIVRQVASDMQGSLELPWYQLRYRDVPSNWKHWPPVQTCQALMKSNYSGSRHWMKLQHPAR